MRDQIKCSEIRIIKKKFQIDVITKYMIHGMT